LWITFIEIRDFQSLPALAGPRWEAFPVNINNILSESTRVINRFSGEGRLQGRDLSTVLGGKWWIVWIMRRKRADFFLTLSLPLSYNVD